MIAIYLGSNQFKVANDRTSEFLTGRRIKANCGVDGYVYSTIESSSYADSYTIVNITDNDLTSNLTDVLYGIINVGEQGSLPTHSHDSSEGQGGQVSFIDLSDTPSSYVDDKYLKSTPSGIVFTDLPNQIASFLDLTDTPEAYSVDKFLMSTATGIAFTDLPGQETYFEYGSGAPTSSGIEDTKYLDIDTGDFYNYYSSVWSKIFSLEDTVTTFSGIGGSGSGIDNVVEDATPQLGGDLDCNGHDISFGAGTISGTGSIITGDHGLDTLPQVVNVVYGIGSPPAVNSTTIGTIFIRYITNERGCFGGGSAASISNVIDYITISTTAYATDFGDLTLARYGLAGLSNGNNERGIFGGGTTGSNSNVIDYITINSTGNATYFGDLTASKRYPVGVSNGTNERGCFGGGYDGSSNYNVIEYITINSVGNATDFGDLTVAKRSHSGLSNGTNERGCFGGGYDSGYTNVIEYITINSVGNAIDFGDLTVAKVNLTGLSNSTNNRGCFGGGYDSNYTNVIEYITINSAGSAVDFGDLTLAREGTGGLSNGTNERGCFGGGSTGSNSNVIDYIAINSAGNATDFGDLTVARSYVAGVANA